jgi:DNA invertase Pin-like site-specific DNA recombinase
MDVVSGHANDMSRHRPTTEPGLPKVIGYVRVSTGEQADSDAGLEAQRVAIRSEAERRGWTLETIYEDSASGKSLNGRPALREALNALSERRASTILVSKLDRLTRSLLDAASLLERASREGWNLIALDLAVDTTTPQGEVMAHVMAAFAQFERRLIGQRTREALAAVRARGQRLGRPPVLTKETVARIAKDRAEGMTLQAIADALMRDGVGTAHGGLHWYPSTISAVLRTALDRAHHCVDSIAI